MFQEIFLKRRESTGTSVVVFQTEFAGSLAACFEKFSKSRETVSTCLFCASSIAGMEHLAATTVDTCQDPLVLRSQRLVAGPQDRREQIGSSPSMSF